MARQKIEETLDFLGNTVHRGDILYTATKRGLELLVVQEIYATDFRGNLMTQPPYGFEDPSEPGVLYVSPQDDPRFTNPSHYRNIEHLELIEEQVPHQYWYEGNNRYFGQRLYQIRGRVVSPYGEPNKRSSVYNLNNSRGHAHMTIQDLIARGG